MSFHIIVKKDSGMRFKPHMNEALGKYVHTKEEYIKGLKEHNLIPQKEAQKIAESKRKDMNRSYKPSKWAHDMTSEIKRTGGNPGGVFYDQLRKKGHGPEKLAKANKQYEKHFKNGE